MSPYEKIEALYLAKPEARRFAWYVDYFNRYGFVFSRPDFFIMGRGVVKAAPKHALLDLSVQFKREDCDCWFVFAMSGDMGAAWHILPWHLPWLAWERHEGEQRDLRFYDTETIKRLSHA